MVDTDPVEIFPNSLEAVLANCWNPPRPPPGQAYFRQKKSPDMIVPLRPDRMTHRVRCCRTPTEQPVPTWAPDRDVLLSKQNKIGTTVISHYDYTVNALGQRTAVATSGTAFPSMPTWLWSYDTLGQVISADHSANNTFDRAYQYDAIGNRLKSADSLTLPANNNYTPNALNQYSSLNNQQSTFNPTYDDDGNQIDAQVLPLGSSSLESCVYAWDAENRLVSATVNGTTTTYLYDSQSRRICTQSPISNSQSTIYIYDGWNPIAEYSTTNLQSPITHVRSYTWGLDLSGSLQGAGGVGGLLSVSEISNSQILNYFPTYDGNGNISEYLDSSGFIAAHYEYDPFGKTTVATGAKSNNFTHRISTKPVDSATGLLYYGYRYCAPSEAWRLLQGASPCRKWLDGGSHRVQGLAPRFVSSLAGMKEGGIRTT